MSKLFSYLPTLGHLLHADFLTFKHVFTDKIIDFFIYSSLTVLVMSHFISGVGTSANFGLFTAATGVAVSGMFEIFPRVMTLLSDLVGNKVISYDVTLPIPSWMAIARIGLSDGLRNLLVGSLSLPFGLLFVWNQFNVHQFSPLWFMLLLVLNSLFFGFFGLLLASLVKNMSKVGSMWMRVIFPLWTLGGFQFTWFTMHAKSSALGYALLLNPFLYTMEGMRAAVLGQAGSLPLWLCATAIISFTFLCAWIGVRRIMKRLDCV
jgi:ABC-2 type transport system permease protein